MKRLRTKVLAAATGVIAIGLSLLYAGNTAATPPDGATGSSQQPLIFGQEVDIARQRDLRLVTIGAHCSGTLINQYWVLTADHCVSTNPDWPAKYREVPVQKSAKEKPREDWPDAPFAQNEITATWSARRVVPTVYVRFWKQRGLDVALIGLGNGDLGPVGTSLIYRGIL